MSAGSCDRGTPTVAGIHDARHEVQRRPVPVAVVLGLARVNTDPHGQPDALLRFERGLHRIGGRMKDAHTPSPVCLNSSPRWAEIVERSSSSCAARAVDMPAPSTSHRCVDDSMSVNRNVTVCDPPLMAPVSPTFAARPAGSPCSSRHERIVQSGPGAGQRGDRVAVTGLPHARRCSRRGRAVRRTGRTEQEWVEHDAPVFR